MLWFKQDTYPSCRSWWRWTEAWIETRDLGLQIEYSNNQTSRGVKNNWRDITRKIKSLHVVIDQNQLICTVSTNKNKASLLYKLLLQYRSKVSYHLLSLVLRDEILSQTILLLIIWLKRHKNKVNWQVNTKENWTFQSILFLHWTFHKCKFNNSCCAP